MRFGKQLELGRYKPWGNYYIQYDRLKRIIVRRRFIANKLLEHAEKGRQTGRLSPFAPITQNIHKSSDEWTPLNFEAESRDSYSKTEIKQLVVDDNADFFPVILEEIERVNKFFVGKLSELRVKLEVLARRRSNVYLTHHTNIEIDLTKLRDIYVELVALRSFCELNQTGFYKIIKKFDKIMEEQTLASWMPVISNQPFTTSAEPQQLLDIVMGLVSRDKLIDWETFATEQQTKSADYIFPTVRGYGLAVSLGVFIASLLVPTIPNDPAASRCASLLLLAICLWITEAIPYFSTAVIIPILVVVMNVLKDPDPHALNADGTRKFLSPKAAAEFVTSHIFNHTTWLLLGGYTISTAFSHCQLELRIASKLQELLGSRPKLFILAIMLVGLFLSMWISNHTAPILCASIILPIVRDLPTESRFSKSILMGLAVACNFGGMMTPISSLQNALAVSYLEQAGIPISFGRWIGVALPFCLLLTVASWMLIIIIMAPDDVNVIPVIVYEQNTKLFGKRNVAVISLSLLAIVLFASSSWSEVAVGDISIISLGFVGLMFGTGLLSQVDFNSLSWHTLFLVGGGNVLGKAIESSGLLAVIASMAVSPLPIDHPWLALLCILLFCGAVATFVSHTVAAIILMPVISRIGVEIAIPEVVVVGSAFAISAAMALPFSSFPNVNSFLIHDDFHRPYLSVNDFIVTGLPMSLISILLIATVGYCLIKLILVPMV